jgi:hypothetical protein
LGQSLTPVRVIVAADETIYVECDANTGKALAAP